MLPTVITFRCAPTGDVRLLVTGSQLSLRHESLTTGSIQTMSYTSNRSEKLVT